MELTKREYDEKQEELSKVLEDLDKALILQREAKSFMDFSENSELDAANHQVMLLQKRRSELQEQLNNCEIITPPRGPRIALGNIIRVTEGAESIDSRNLAASKSLVLLSYISIRLKYYNKKRLDFSKYPGMRSAVRVLINFTKQRTVNMQTMRSLNKLIELLVIIEDDYVQYRRGLAYRFIRLFIVLVLYGNFVNAAVVADFILNQLITKEDYR